MSEAPARSLSQAADEVVAVLHAFASAPFDLGGLCVRAWAGPRRTLLLDWYRAALSRTSHANNASATAPSVAWRVLPHHADPGQLESGIDIGLSLAQGRPVPLPGLLDHPTPPVVVVSMAERMGLGLSAAVAAALDARRLALVLLDESLEDEQGPWTGLLDRLALHVDLRNERLLAAVLERLELLSHDGSLGDASDSRPVMPEALLEQLAALSIQLDVRSARPLGHTVRLATQLAAPRGPVEIQEAELALSIRFALLPHARQLPQPPAEDSSPAAPEAEDQTPADPPDPNEGDDPDRTPARPDESDLTDTSDEQRLPDGAAERLIEAAIATLPADMLVALAGSAVRTRAQASGAGQLTARGRGRGRSIGARRGIPQGAERLHLFATLRAAIPWQRLRAGGLTGREMPGGQSSRPRLQLRKDDLHRHRELHRRGTTTVFVVDASGSTALQRLNEAKGAVELLLADCYVRRDRVALVSFRGRGAEMLLSPTRSLVAARRALGALPGGGGSPVAAGLEMAARLVTALARSGDDTQVVVLTDGRANLTRDGRPGRAEAASEAQALARQLGQVATQCVLIDTAMRPDPAARALAEAMQARYCPMPFARAQAIRAVIG
jgi:magnesium chelatase subunit D